jgi:hypothetical protein
MKEVYKINQGYDYVVASSFKEAYEQVQQIILKKKKTDSTSNSDLEVNSITLVGRILGE